MYPDPRVVRFVQEHFVPVRVHVREQREEFQRLGGQYNARWTPTILIVDGSGEERHRIEGFLPAEDLLGQLALGLGQAGFAVGDFAAAERQFREVVEKHSTSDAAAEALYWAGVSQYKATGDSNALADTARQFGERYQDTSWAKKASVWKRS